MSRYITINEAISVVTKQQGMRGNTLKALYSAPTIDIVRCKECKRWWGNHYHDNEDGKCPMDAWIDGDGFCSYGEREGE